MTGKYLASRLLENIQSSMTLRAKIPYLDILKDLIQGGATFNSATLNSSSNFGSLDTALKTALGILHALDERLIPAPSVSPLPLSLIYANLIENVDLLEFTIDQHLRDTPSYTLVNQLELISLSAV